MCLEHKIVGLCFFSTFDQVIPVHMKSTQDIAIHFKATKQCMPSKVVFVVQILLLRVLGQF